MPAFIASLHQLDEMGDMVGTVVSDKEVRACRPEEVVDMIVSSYWDDLWYHETLRPCCSIVQVDADGTKHDLGVFT